MASQHWHAARGRRLSSPHTCWHTWSGGELITTLCVLTTHCEWRSCSHERRVASWWRNGTDNGLPRWQPEELIDDGRQARCSLVPCRRFPLERHKARYE